MQRQYFYTATDFEIVDPHKPSATKKPIQHLEKSPNYFSKSGPGFFKEHSPHHGARTSGNIVQPIKTGMKDPKKVFQS